ncbi:hypothetical protein J1614_007692 [Plenodomus biglobosus]|nr:hypothetical protein J1614_007692 [Plenodomus biglobosus]
MWRMREVDVTSEGALLVGLALVVTAGCSGEGPTSSPAPAPGDPSSAPLRRSSTCPLRQLPYRLTPESIVP